MNGNNYLCIQMIKMFMKYVMKKIKNYGLIEYN